MPTKKVTFYFDFISPYSYFAWQQLPGLQSEFAVDIDYQAILFAALLNHFDNVGPAEVSAKRRYMYENCVRYAVLNHIPFVGPPSHPFKPLLALRLASEEVAGEDLHRVCDALWSGCWAEGKEISDENVVRDLLSGAGLDGSDLVAKTKEDTIKQALRQRTDNAIATNIFGVPSFVVDDQLFWGNDSIDHLRLYLTGKDPIDRKLVEEILSRPRGASRKL